MKIKLQYFFIVWHEREIVSWAIENFCFNVKKEKSFEMLGAVMSQLSILWKFACHFKLNQQQNVFWFAHDSRYAKKIQKNRIGIEVIV